MENNKVSATFDYEIVKKAVKLHYPSIDFKDLDTLPDSESCPVYLDYFSKMLKKYGVYNEAVKLVRS